jgi:DnaK suppressor protein
MATTSRAHTIRRLLEERKRRLTADMQGMIRDVRQTGRTEARGADEQDVAAADQQSDVDLAVIQMKAETMARIDSALRRLDQGSFGDCVECGEKITVERLKALPFALRCRDCEDLRERAQKSRTVGQAPSWRDQAVGYRD